MGMPIYCFFKTFQLNYLDSVLPARWCFLPPLYTCLNGVALAQHSEATLTPRVLRMFECVCVCGEWDHYSLSVALAQHSEATLTPRVIRMFECVCVCGEWDQYSLSANRRSSKISDYQAIIHVFLLNYAVTVNLDEARGTQKNTQGVWPGKLPIDSLPLQQLALSPALMSCLSKQPRW